MTPIAQRSGYEVVGTFKETGSGMKLDRIERRKVTALASRIIPKVSLAVTLPVIQATSIHDGRLHVLIGQRTS